MNALATASAAAAQPHSDAVKAPRGWRLEAHLAITLRPRVPSRLLITDGRAWVTLGVAPQGRGNESGDVVLCAGESLRVSPGARLVVEPWQPAGAGPVRFDWQIEPLAIAAAPWRDGFVHEVVLPSREVAQALWQVGAAMARLVRGVFGYGGLLVTGRGRALAPACEPGTH